MILVHNSTSVKVINIHKRIIPESIDKVAGLLKTLATREDKIWPYEDWPPMRFKEGLKEGASGGHGPIGYTIAKYDPKALIRFVFSRPSGFNGIHQLEMTEQGPNQTMVRHIIDMTATGIGILSWTFGIRWLHDALIEDAFDKMENYFSDGPPKRTPWNLWVRILRKILS